MSSERLHHHRSNVNVNTKLASGIYLIHNYPHPKRMVSQEAVPRSILAYGTFFRGNEFPSSADSRRARCQLLAKEWVLNTGKLPPGGLPRNGVVK